MRERTISVVITGINCANCLSKLLESLSKQRVKPLEIIYIDGGSSDDSAKIAREFSCKVIVDSDAKTPAKGRNIGLKISKGTFVLFLDSDCIAPDDLLEKYTFHLQLVSGNIAGIGSRYEYSESDNDYVNAFSRALKCFLVNGGSPQFNLWKKIKKVNRLPGGNSCYKRDILLKLNGFREDLKFCEEYELGRRLRKLGYRLLYVPELFVFHRSFPSILAALKKIYSYGFWRGFYMITEGLIDFPQLIILLVLFLLISLLSVGFEAVVETILLTYLLGLLFNVISSYKKNLAIRNIILTFFMAVLIQITYISSLVIGVIRGILSTLVCRFAKG